MKATDGDASPPNNVLKYELSESGSSERSTNYFKIDPETGEISIKDDLTQELYDEYRVSDRGGISMILLVANTKSDYFQLEVRAYDMGEPPLDSTVIVVVRVLQVISVSRNHAGGI